MPEIFTKCIAFVTKLSTLQETDATKEALKGEIHKTEKIPNSPYALALKSGNIQIIVEEGFTEGGEGSITKENMHEDPGKIVGIHIKIAEGKTLHARSNLMTSGALLAIMQFVNDLNESIIASTPIASSS